jgi:hypothetical protein
VIAVVVAVLAVLALLSTAAFFVILEHERQEEGPSR